MIRGVTLVLLGLLLIAYSLSMIEKDYGKRAGESWRPLMRENSR